MKVLKPLEDVGPTKAFFRLGEEDGQAFTYYTFLDDRWDRWDPSDPKWQKSYWDVIGLRQHTIPWRLELRLKHFEEDELWAQATPDFEAVRDAGGFVSLDPDDLDVLIAFLTNQLRSSDPPTSIAPLPLLAQFRQLGADELSSLRVHEAYISHERGNIYRYTPTMAAQEVCLVRVPTGAASMGAIN